MKNASHGPGPAKRVFLKSFLGQIEAESWLSGNGKRPFTIRMAGKPSHSSQIFSLRPGSTPEHIS